MQVQFQKDLTKLLSPVAGEARLIAHVEALAKKPHPLDRSRCLQLPQSAVTHFAFIHLDKEPERQTHSENKQIITLKSFVGVGGAAVSRTS